MGDGNANSCGTSLLRSARDGDTSSWHHRHTCVFLSFVRLVYAHSPPILLIIDHIHTFGTIIVEDQTGILLAVTHSDRVRRIHLRMHVPPLTRLIAAIDGAFPLQESLHIQLLPAGRQLVTTLNTSSFKYHFSTISCCLALPFRLAHYCVPGSSHTQLNIFNYLPYRRQMVRA